MDYLKNSNNPWHQLIANTSKQYNSQEVEVAKKRRIAVGDGSDDVTVISAVHGKSDSWLTNQIQSNNTFRKQYMRSSGVHLSEEGITDTIFAAWAVQKDSPWREALNKYILLLDQVQTR